MQLSKRLKAIADMVSGGNRLVDVGCDHGYIPIWLVEQGKIPGAIAMDINKGPLLRAKANIEKHGLSCYIETRVSDGVSALAKGEGDTLVIAGMGGPLTERILSEGEKALKEFSEFILEPQSEIGHMRKFLQENRYKIVEEDMVYEDGKFYPVMKVIHGGMEPLKEEEAVYGPCLLRDGHPVLYEYLIRELQVSEQLSQKLQALQSEGAARRYEELCLELEVIRQALHYYE